jgi:HD-GYP domain-containing protein (c-di-GMP phosphodiesterase class II)
VFSRPKRWRLSPHQAADELVRQSGSAFASAAVNRFLRVMGFFPNGSLVELNDGRLAVVVRQNDRGLLKPIVRLTSDNGEELDLKLNPAVFIKRQIMEY